MVLLISQCPLSCKFLNKMSAILFWCLIIITSSKLIWSNPERYPEQLYPNFFWMRTNPVDLCACNIRKEILYMGNFDQAHCIHKTSLHSLPPKCQACLHPTLPVSTHQFKLESFVRKSVAQSCPSFSASYKLQQYPEKSDIPNLHDPKQKYTDKVREQCHKNIVCKDYYWWHHNVLYHKSTCRENSHGWNP